MHVWCHDILSLYIRHHTQDRITLIVISSPSPFFLFLSCLPLLLYDRVCDSILLLDSSVFDAIFLASLRLHLCSTKIPLAFARGYSQKEGSQLKTSSSHLCMCILYQLINKSLVGQEYADKEHIRSFRM